MRKGKDTTPRACCPNGAAPGGRGARLGTGCNGRPATPKSMHYFSSRRFTSSRTCGDRARARRIAGARPARARTDCATYTRWPTANVRLGHRVNANTHKPIRFTSGTNARIVHHRLWPARCRIFATGTATMMSKRSGIPRGVTQCHSGGIASQNQNWSQKKVHFLPPRFFVTSSSLVQQSQ